ncbi:AMP-binding protein [Brachybacterium sp. YJGR34]|uniref:AMP-binding protein n=1 Tax=Brachybacterium sp. YJGR34 TaxID=2059911 RepID=UPI000E0A5B64|nr:AMP-binding protein [Brachybacterium sp. YJGR34]
MRILHASTALRARAALRPRSELLVDRHGTLTAGDLLDQVSLLRRRSRRLTGPPRLGMLPATAPLREVLLTVLAGDGMLEMRSSGTGGRPRLQRRGPLTGAQVRHLADLGRRIGLRRGRRIASAAPGVHGHGLLVALGAVAVGAPLVDLSHLPAAERISLLHATSPALLTGVPVHLADLLRAQQELGESRDLSLDRVISGSDELSPALRADLSREFRAQVHDVYGTTETGVLAVDGRPLRGVHLRAVDGRLHARSPFTGGRELVTDRGEVAADGTVHVTGRAEVPSSLGGLLHDPAEVRQLLLEQPGVLAVRLRPVPDARAGVRTLAEVLVDGSTDRPRPGEDEIRALVRDRLSAAAMPREVRISSPGR